MTSTFTVALASTVRDASTDALSTSVVPPALAFSQEGEVVVLTSPQVLLQVRERLAMHQVHMRLLHRELASALKRSKRWFVEKHLQTLDRKLLKQVVHSPNASRNLIQHCQYSQKDKTTLTALNARTKLLENLLHSSQVQFLHNIVTLLHKHFADLSCAERQQPFAEWVVDQLSTAGYCTLTRPQLLAHVTYICVQCKYLRQ